MDNKKLTLAITKALAYTENGGKPTVSKAGKTGELKSIFQFEPATWKAYSKEVTGQDNIPISPESEAYVVSQKVGKWVDQLEKEGKSVEEIPKIVASIWNAGPGQPNAYKGMFSSGSSSKGINKKYGIQYDVPEYANKVESYTKEFLNDPENPANKSQNDPKERAILDKLASIANTAKSQQPTSQVAQNTQPSPSGQFSGMIKQPSSAPQQVS